MATDWSEVLKDVRKSTPLLKQANGDMMSAFEAVRQASHSEDVLDAKTRELIAIAVSVSRHCEGCIASHVQKAKQAGATREEIGASIGVAIAIAAGSAYVYSLKALDAYEQL